MTQNKQKIKQNDKIEIIIDKIDNKLNDLVKFYSDLNILLIDLRTVLDIEIEDKPLSKEAKAILRGFKHLTKEIQRKCKKK